MADPDQATAALRLLFTSYEEAEGFARKAFGLPDEKRKMPICVQCASEAHKLASQGKPMGEVGSPHYDASAYWCSELDEWRADETDCYGDRPTCSVCGVMGWNDMRWVPATWIEGDPVPDQDFCP